MKKKRLFLSMILLLCTIITGNTDAAEEIQGAGEASPVQNMSGETQETIQQNSLELGQFIELGRFRGNPIVWRVVGFKSNQPLLMSHHILSVKPYDLKKNEEEGMKENRWEESSLHWWLNSDKEEGEVFVDFPQVLPLEEEMDDAQYDAFNEAGFLSEFSLRDIGYLDSKTTERDFKSKVFLMSEEEIINGLGMESLRLKPSRAAVEKAVYVSDSFNEMENWHYWLIDQDESALHKARVVTARGVITSQSTNTTFIGVAPGILLRENFKIHAGQGTIENPYRDAYSGVSQFEGFMEEVTVERASKEEALVVEKTDQSGTFSLKKEFIEAVAQEKLALKVKTQKTEVTIPKKVLTDQLNLPNNESVNFEIEESPDISRKIEEMIRKKYPNATYIDELTQFSMKKIGKDRRVEAITEFEEPLKVIIKDVNGFEHQSKTAVYYVNPILDETGELLDVELYYSGGEATSDGMVFYTDHFSLFIVMESKSTFPDMEQSKWATEAIETLAARGIVKGFPDGRFRPKNHVNRVDFSVMLNNSLGKRPAKYQSVFQDVKASDYFSGHVLSLNEYGATDIKAMEGNRLSDDMQQLYRVYNPTNHTQYQEITREETATFIANAYRYLRTFRKDLPVIKPKVLQYIDKESIRNQTMADNISIVNQLQIMRGYPDNSFQPKGVLTRAEAAQTITVFLTKFNLKLN